MTSLRVNEQLTLSFPPGDAIARLAGLSPAAALRTLAAAIADAQGQSSPLTDWAEGYLDRRDLTARFDDGELFVSYRQFCEALKLPAADRLSYPAFDQEMAALGLAADMTDPARPMRRGCVLRKRRPVRMVLDGEASVEEFLAACCRIEPRGSKARVRSMVLHGIYAAWASGIDRDAIGMRRFAQQMELLGLRRQKSNGIWWGRIALLPSTPRPLGEVEGNSKVDGQA